jgi:hypothetical protein
MNHCGISIIVVGVCLGPTLVSGVLDAHYNGI